MSTLHTGGRRVGLTVRLLRARDGDACRRCGEAIDFDLSGLLPLGPTLGHVVPAAAGGSDELRNLGLEHRRCNLAAGARRDPPRAWIAKPLDYSAR